MQPVPVLSIAGSDPSGGAGVQADLKTFADHGCFGMAVITALTAQNTTGVSAIHAAPLDFVAEQVRMVRADIPPLAIKVGMLGTVGLVRTVLAALDGYSGPVVLDPVMVATSGARLLLPDAEAALREELVPRATVLTPNLPEAAVLLGDQPPQAWADRTGVALLLKDGHGQGQVVRDRLYLPGGGVVPVDHPRLHSRNTHGTGCTLASALAARLARGEPLPLAAQGALRYVADLVAISQDHRLGAGKGPLLHGALGPR
jgi:hydroxymethylpyrimidine/phosphomethylpyrimidine kinase